MMAGGIGAQGVALLLVAPGVYLDASAHLALFRSGILIEGACIAAGLAYVRCLRRLWFPALVAMQCVLGVWMLHASPHPQIDVVTVHRIFRGYRLRMACGCTVVVQGSYKIRSTQWYLCIDETSGSRVDIDRDSVMLRQREGTCQVTS